MRHRNSGSVLLSTALAALIAMAATPAREDDHVVGTRSEKLVEKSHQIELKMDRGHAEFVVRRTVWNGGARHDQAIFHIELSAGAVATGLRTLGMKDGKPFWFKGDLMEAEAAANKYCELTGIGGFHTKDRALLSSLSVPTIQIWEGVLTVPIVGPVDNQRASLIMNELLAAVVRTGAHYAILDLTGVEAIDMATADHFLKIVQVVKLVGAEAIITGIAPPVANTLIALGVDVSRVVTLSTLEEALKYCMKSMGYSVKRH